MRILFVTDSPLPATCTASHLTAEMTQGSIDSGHEVEIVCPVGEPIAGVSFQGYYDMATPVEVHRIGAAQHTTMSSLFARSTYRSALASFLAERGHTYDILYSLSPVVLPVLIQSGRPVIMEVWTLPARGHKKFIQLLGRCRCVIAATHALRSVLVDAGLTTTPIAVEGGAINLRRCTPALDIAPLRARYDIVSELPTVGFVGPFDREASVAAFSFAMQSMSLLAERGLEFQILAIGGPEKGVSRLQSSFPPALRDKTRFTGAVPYTAVSQVLSLCSAGIIAAPSRRTVHSLRDSVPLSAYEWMAAGVPVLVPDTAPMREQFTERSVAFYNAGDTESLAQVLRDALVSSDTSRERALNALSDVSSLQWQPRMSRILGTLNCPKEHGMNG